MSESTTGRAGRGRASGAEILGAEVRAWRLHAGLSQRELGEKAQYGQQYVAKVESGERLASPEFCRACDQIFGSPESFARLRERATQSGYPDWFIPYLQLERQATSILNYSVALVMGMLQTEDYATAVFRASHPRDGVDEIKARVARRLKRRVIMERSAPPLLWCVLDESCLRREVGGRHVMHDQLSRLVKDAQSPHITLQVLPWSSGAPSTHLGFTLLKFAEDPDLLYVENPLSGQVIDSPAVVADAAVTYDRLRADALSPEASLVLMRKVMEEYTP
ncbi:helix-turn-helix domain-containing protein [Peterkaempfera bronchialis]|uniref:XRE family transcriptional regulator n=1 Tax=Peterkaempfera bronchialis TaxID=2126346 RepID=A0A345SZ33_9ACTN|nr:helix-turn-helix transcriptional regulator [Peterkaempfera bronchialis]AXI78988.1 XRE family transcriptional regulator [Peterkaempfera bronchialis]